MRTWAWLVLLAVACAGDDGMPTGDASTTSAPTTSTGPAVTDSSSDGTVVDGSTTALGSTSGEPDGTSTGQPLPQPGPDEVVELFAAEHIWFGEENHRQVDIEIELPPTELHYANIQLGIVLGCPNDLCDWWDRLGFIGVVHDVGTEQESVTELARFVTPYRVGATWIVDVTHLRPLLAGSRTIRLFIDTWVGPGHENGEGWLVDASLQYLGGVPDTVPVEVIELWPATTSVEYGNPGLPIDETVPPVTVAIPADATKVELRSIITGHGQGNADNCAEFCPRTHGFAVGDDERSRLVWRDDCDRTPVQGQQGTWTLSRAGWCPGAEVLPWIEDVTSAIVPGDSVTLAYDVEEYVNTCAPRSPECTGCTLGTGCEYDGGNHTVPRYQFAAQLVISRAP